MTNVEVLFYTHFHRTAIVRDEESISVREGEIFPPSRADAAEFKPVH